MIHTIIQIFVMALLFFAIFRESKRDRLNQMQQIDDIRKFFDLQAEYIARQAKALQSAIKAQIELTYAERHDEITKRFEYFAELIEVYVTKDAISKEEFSRLCTRVTNSNAMLAQILGQISSESTHSELKAIGTCLSDLNSQLSTLNSQLTSIEAPVKLWGEAQVKNEIKKGEANRTLRHKLQENRKYIKSMEQSLQMCSNRLSALSTELEQAKSAARDIVAETMKEISLIRSWMEERGVPIAPLEKLLTKEFKGNIPSQVYTRTKNEQALQETLSN